MSNKPIKKTLAQEFYEYYTQLMRDGKDWLLCLNLTIEMFEYKLVEHTKLSGMFDFIDHTGCYICNNGGFQFYETKAE